MAINTEGLSSEELMAMLSEEEDMNQVSNYSYAIVGDQNCSHLKDSILEFLHQKDLLSSVDISSVYMKSSMTVLLEVEEDIEEDQLDQINRALQNHKEFSFYKVVNWVTYQSIHSAGSRKSSGGSMGQGSGDDDEEGFNNDALFEVADNHIRSPRTAIHSRHKKPQARQKQSQDELEEEYQKIDKEKIEATIIGIDASITSWLNQERSKQNTFLRKKSLQTDISED